jgi:hypothetical protein
VEAPHEARRLVPAVGQGDGAHAREASRLGEEEVAQDALADDADPRDGPESEQAQRLLREVVPESLALFEGDHLAEFRIEIEKRWGEPRHRPRSTLEARFGGPLSWLHLGYGQRGIGCSRSPRPHLVSPYQAVCGLACARL